MGRLPSHSLAQTLLGAGNGTRTRDPELGRLALYQLSYSRSPLTLISWWRGEDSNLRRHKPADLQSAPFGHSGTSPPRNFDPQKIFCRPSRWRESNSQHPDYKSGALPLSYIGNVKKGKLFLAIATVKERVGPTTPSRFNHLRGGRKGLTP